jgi:hypothetical protein
MNPAPILTIGSALILIILAIALLTSKKYPDLAGPDLWRTSIKRLLIIAIVSSIVLFIVFVGIVLSLEGFDALDELPPILMIFLIYGIFLGICLGVVAFFSLFVGFTVALALSKKTYRRSLFFGMACFLPMMIFLFYSNEDGLGGAFLFCSLGVVLGLFNGPLNVRRLRKQIVDEKIIFHRSSFQARNFRESLTYWKGALAIIGIAGAAAFSIRGGHNGWIITFFGLLTTTSLYTFIWVLIYEKRHNVRLTIEYSDAGREAIS